MSWLISWSSQEDSHVWFKVTLEDKNYPGGRGGWTGEGVSKTETDGKGTQQLQINYSFLKKQSKGGVEWEIREETERGNYKRGKENEIRSGQKKEKQEEKRKQVGG